MRERTVRISALFLGLISFLLAVGFAREALAASKTYTTSADFEEGILTGVNHDPPNENQLTLESTLSTFPFIWIANSGEGTVSKLDTLTGRELGRYRTGRTSGSNPSRTTVDLEGSVWVGNRGENTVTKIGLVEAENCRDTNGNGAIDTSTDLNDNGHIESSEILCWGCDECILNYVTVGTTNPRAVAVDENNNVWVGGGVFGGSKLMQKLDGDSGAILRTIDIGALANGSGGYGALVDGNGILWVSTDTSGGGAVLRIDPNLPDGDPNLVRRINLAAATVYGLGIDQVGNIFASGWDAKRLAKIAPNGTVIFDIYIPDSRYHYSRGVAVTADSDVWVANSSTHYVTRHDNTTGAVKAAVNLGASGASAPTGVTVDADGRVWVPCVNTDNVAVIDPATDRVIATYRVGDYPYNYSDMTGHISRTVTSPSGSWITVCDGGKEGIQWTKVNWNTEPEGKEPPGTAIIVEVRVADSVAALGSQPYVQVSNNVSLTGIQGRYIQVRCTLQLASAGIVELPVLSDITLFMATAEEFVWQQIDVDGEVYTVKVTAEEKPIDPSAFVYPVYCGTCDQGYEPALMKVENSYGNVVTDENTIREVMAYARNAALYRSWFGLSSDPVPILSKVSEFTTVTETLPFRSCCWLDYCLFEKGGGTDTSFYREYPSYLRFPGEYRDAENAVPALVDWEFEWTDILGAFCDNPGDYIHPTGIKNEEARKDIYVQALRHMVLQDGVDEISDDVAKILTDMLSVNAAVLLAEGTAEGLDTALLLLDIVDYAKTSSSVAWGLKKAFEITRPFNAQQVAAMSRGFAPNHYTALSAKYASCLGPVMNAVSLGFHLAEIPGEVAHFFLNYALLQAHGQDVLANTIESLKTATNIDPALLDALNQIERELGNEPFVLFAGELAKELDRIALEVQLDLVQIGISTAAVVATGTIVGVPLGAALAAVDCAISLTRLVCDLISDKLEHEQLQQAIVLLSTLEGTWYDHPLGQGLDRLSNTNPVTADVLEELNWNISSKLYTGLFVTSTLWDENSGLLNSILEWLGNDELRSRRQTTEAFRKRLINIILGKGDTDEVLGRLAGRPSSGGEYIGFVPKRELKYLVERTTATEWGSTLPIDQWRFLLNSPGEIGIVDPAGRHLGVFANDTGGGNFALEELGQIPGGSYSGRGSEPCEITVPALASGSYEIQLFGMATGPYHLQVQGLSGGMIISESEAVGVFEPNRMEDGVFQVQIGEDGFTAEIVSEPTPRGIVRGTVVDALTGAPVNGARVIAGNASDMTEHDGAFKILNVTQGNLLITAEATGYTSFASDMMELAAGATLEYRIFLTAAGVQNATNRTSISYSGVTFNRTSNIQSGNCTIKNRSTNTLGKPIKLVIESVSDPTITVPNADGTTADGKPYFDFSGSLGADNELTPGETSSAKVIQFRNPNRIRFTWTKSVWAVVK